MINIELCETTVLKSFNSKCLHFQSFRINTQACVVEEERLQFLGHCFRKCLRWPIKFQTCVCVRCISDLVKRPRDTDLCLPEGQPIGNNLFILWIDHWFVILDNFYIKIVDTYFSCLSPKFVLTNLAQGQ